MTYYRFFNLTFKLNIVIFVSHYEGFSHFIGSRRKERLEKIAPRGGRPDPIDRPPLPTPLPTIVHDHFLTATTPSSLARCDMPDEHIRTNEATADPITI